MTELACWRTSSYTTGQGNCVEVGQARDAVVVRDTKNRGIEALSISPTAWHALLATINR